MTICLVLVGAIGIRETFVAAGYPTKPGHFPATEPTPPTGAFGLPQVREEENDTPGTKQGYPSSMRVRVEWGGGSPIAWQESIEVVGGRITHVASLGLEEDEQAAIYMTPAGKLQIEPRQGRIYRGVDITIASNVSVRGPIDAELHVVMDPTRAAAKVVAMDLIRKPYQLELPGGNRLSVRRAPGDALQVDLRRESLVFQAGEATGVDITPNMPAVALDGDVRLTATIIAARQSKALWSAGIELSAPALDTDKWPKVPLSLQMPGAEGVYDLVLELHERSLKNRLLLDKPLERRKVQFVVLSPQAPPRPMQSFAPPAQVLTTIDPTQAGWLERLKVHGVPSLRRGSSGNCKPTLRQHPAGAFVELPPSAVHDDPSWQAYPISNARPGEPHTITVEYPADVEQSLGIALVEPNAPGAATTVGIDSGLHVEAQLVPPSPAVKSHRVVVWPRTASPTLVLTNRRADLPAVFGKISFTGPLGPTLAELPAELLPGRVREAASLPRAAMPDARGDGRLLAAYFDRPLVPENFAGDGAPDGDDPSRPLDDWVTFYESSRRLVEYLTYAGYNGAMITVAADGGSIYPSKLLGATPRYDDGTFFSTGQDPVQKDVLEMLLRMFDREGLRLVPAVRFPSRLPRFEAARRETIAKQNTPSASIDAKEGFVGTAYNPLDAELQSEMIAVVEELQRRYGKHPSFAGVGVHLAVDGYTQFPGVDWGADLRTMPQFLAESQLAAPAGATMPQLAAAIFSQHRDAWLAWRADKLAEFYGRMRTAAAGDSPSHQLFLIAAHCWERPDIERRLQPTLRRGETPEQILLESGLDPARLALRPGVTFVRPYRTASATGVAERTTTQELNANAALDRAAAEQPLPAAMVYHEPSTGRIASLGKLLGDASYDPRFVVQPTSDAARNRRLLVHQLATLDGIATFDGGWLLPNAADDVRRIAGVIRSLPAEKFTTVPGGPSHVVVRTLERDGHTFMYVANDSPWPTTVTIDIGEPAKQLWEGFGVDAGSLGWSQEHGIRWSATLAPYDVVAGKFLGTGVNIGNIAATPDAAIAPALAEHLRKVWLRLAELQRAPAAVPMPCGDFEPVAAIAAADPWQTRTAQLTFDGNLPHAGQQCGRLSGNVAGAAIVGPPLALRGTGRLALSVWLRAAAPEQPKVRLSFRGLLDGEPYTRSASIGGDEPALSDEWRQFVFQVADLPVRGLHDLRVVVELTTPGVVLIDDVCVYDLDFTEAERLEISKRLTAAESKLQRGEPAECARLLESYALQLPMLPSQREVIAVAAGRRATIAPAAGAPAGAGETSTAVRDRVRQILPKFLR